MPQYNVLRIPKGVHPKGHPRFDIINRMIEPAPDVTRLIDRLSQESLAERFVSDSDKRLSMTRITDKGLKLLSRVKSEIDSLGSFISKALSNSEKKTLSYLLEKIYKEQVK